MITPDKVIRYRRKTLSISIDTFGRLIVRAPKRCSEQRIFAFIQEKEPWIRKKQAERKGAGMLLPPENLDGYTFFIARQSHPNQASRRQESRVRCRAKYRLLTLRKIKRTASQMAERQRKAYPCDGNGAQGGGNGRLLFLAHNHLGENSLGVLLGRQCNSLHLPFALLPQRGH